MQVILRIMECFPVQNRGLIYVTRSENTNDEVRLGDVFWDLSGNRFRVTGIEMPRMCFGASCDYQQFSLLFESLDGAEVCGRLLMNEAFEINWLFCNHPLYQRKVDEDYLDEYEACKEKYNCALFSYEDMERGKLSLYGNELSGITIYRGWQMKPEMYLEFYNALKEKGIILINTPEEYNCYHMLPGWYDQWSEFTAKSVWAEKNGIESQVESLLDNFEGAVIVKDYVKSRKHEWYEACFIPDAKDKKNAKQVIDNFIKRQGDMLVGGVVLREFLSLMSIGFHEKSGMPISEEYRVFILGGRIKIIDNYWTKEDDVKLSDAELEFIQNIATLVKSNFVTVDLARCVDGSLKIMEFGDGQVSGLQEILPGDFYGEL